MIAAKQSDLTPAQRAHIRRVLWLMLVYAIVLPPLVWLRATRHISDGLVLIMAIVASMPVLGMLASWGRYLSDERDEYHQSLSFAGSPSRPMQRWAPPSCGVSSRRSA